MKSIKNTLKYYFLYEISDKYINIELSIRL